MYRRIWQRIRLTACFTGMVKLLKPNAKQKATTRINTQKKCVKQYACYVVTLEGTILRHIQMNWLPVSLYVGVRWTIEWSDSMDRSQTMAVVEVVWWSGGSWEDMEG